MSGQPMMISAGQVASIEGETSASVWFERAGHYAAEAVANAERVHRHRIESRLDKPTRRWTTREVFRTYHANGDGERRYREEAEVLTQHGYQGWLEMEHAGHPLGGRLLLAMRLGVPAGHSGGRTSRSRTVTWTKEAAT